MLTRSPVAFFRQFAGWSWDPAKETEAEGRARGARALARAERKASEAGCSFKWDIDRECDSSEFDDSPEPWSLWVCTMRAPDGRVLGVLGGVDFGSGGEPWGDPYRRVVEAELALEHFGKV